jgi:uncharacterized protein (TIGR00369 family)
MVDRPYPIRIAQEDAFDALIGFVVDDTSEIGRLTGHLQVLPKVCQPMGLVHGGVYAAIAETLASQGTGRGVISEAEPKAVMGMSNNTTFMRPATEGTLHAVARAIHRGRTTWVWDVEMTNDDGKICAMSRVTIAIRDPR